MTQCRNCNTENVTCSFTQSGCEELCRMLLCMVTGSNAFCIPPPILEKGAFPKSQIGAAEASPVFHAILQSYNPPVFRRQFLCCGLFIFFICSSFLAKSVTPWFAQCHGNQTPMCMKMRLLWSVCLEFVGPMDPYLIRVCVHVWASLFA